MIRMGNLIPPPMELVRLAIPRRVYTQSHIDYVLEIVLEVFKNRKSLKGYKIIYEAPMLRHFTARFEMIKVMHAELVSASFLLVKIPKQVRNDIQ